MTNKAAGTLMIRKEVAALEKMTALQLRDRYQEVFGEPSHSGNRAFLIRRIAWRLQAKAEGDLSERAKRRAAELADDADIRLNPPRQPRTSVVARIGPSSAPAAGTPRPGTVLTRTYKRREIRVSVLDGGFEFEGEKYKSLSAVAKAITGTHWNGRLFFGLTTASRKKGATA